MCLLFTIVSIILTVFWENFVKMLVIVLKILKIRKSESYEVLYYCVIFCHFFSHSCLVTHSRGYSLKRLSFLLHFSLEYLYCESAFEEVYRFWNFHLWLYRVVLRFLWCYGPIQLNGKFYNSNSYFFMSCKMRQTAKNFWEIDFKQMPKMYHFKSICGLIFLF